MSAEGRWSDDVTSGRSPFVVSANEGVGRAGSRGEARCCQAEESVLAGAGFSKATVVALTSDKSWASFQHS